MDRIDGIAQFVADVLGPTLVGSYLHGSSVLGGLKPASDLDVFVIARRRMDGQERRALLEGLLRAGEAGDRPIELTVVAHPDVRPWRYPPIADFWYGEWLRDELLASGPPKPRPLPDLALQIANVLLSNCPLVGPPPARVLDPVPRADLVRASMAGIRGLLDDLGHDTRNVVLTIARIWSTIVTGEIRSKDAAADWALVRLPPQHRPVLDFARQLYLDCRYSDESWSGEDQAKARRYVDAVLAEIDRISDRQGTP